MTTKHVAVHFHPSGLTIRVPEGTLLAQAAEAAGLPLTLPCGGEGICGRCRVLVRWHTDVETEEEVLACRTSVVAACDVTIPPALVTDPQQRILTDAGSVPGARVPCAAPRFRLIDTKMQPPDRDHDEDDLSRLEEALGLGPVRGLDVPTELLRDLPQRLRHAGWVGTAVLAGARLVDWLPGSESSLKFLGAAVDLGTTTLATELIDLATGRPVAVTARANPQARFGDDILSRINHLAHSPNGARQLTALVRQAVREMLVELAESAGTSTDRIHEIVVSGNTTMQQIFAGIDSTYLGQVPFTPVVSRSLLLPGVELELDIHPRGSVYIPPIIGGFVGGDIVSGMVATMDDDGGEPALLIDIGTNGEIVLSANGQLVATATAAGPAFEGARILHGMRAAPGAIERVSLRDPLEVSTIANAPARGICGSGLIDLAAELLRCLAIEPNGRMLSADAYRDVASAEADRLERTGYRASAPWIAERLVTTDQGPSFVIATDAEAANGEPIVLTQRDVRQLQLAVGAIRAGTTILLTRHGLDASQLGAIHIAGGFGNYVHRSSAIRTGLLPPDIPLDRIHPRGNTSLAGARMQLTCEAHRAAAQALARRTAHIDLSADPEFQLVFAESMIFPSDEG